MSKRETRGTHTANARAGARRVPRLLRIASRARGRYLKLFVTFSKRSRWASPQLGYDRSTRRPSKLLLERSNASVVLGIRVSIACTVPRWMFLLGRPLTFFIHKSMDTLTRYSANHANSWQACIRAVNILDLDGHRARIFAVGIDRSLVINPFVIRQLCMSDSHICIILVNNWS